ncbi:hypothetical protein DNO10_26475, partial [Escherichia coli]|nr:hypothetical protein [Escherichia coli]
MDDFPGLAVIEHVHDIAVPGVDFATALSLRRMATSTGATPAYLLAPEVSALLFYMPDQRH